jgi:hypothetical protein
MTETVEIREDTQYTPYCTVCKKVIGAASTIWREVNAAAGKHEEAEHAELTEDA